MRKWGGAVRGVAGRALWPVGVSRPSSGGGGEEEQHPRIDVQVFLPPRWQMSFSNVTLVINLGEKLEYADRWSPRQPTQEILPRKTSL